MMGWIIAGSRNPRGIRQKVFWTMVVLITIITISLFLLVHVDLFISYLAAANLVSFSLFSMDKFQALGGRTRVPESSLVTSMLIGGFIGALVSMLLFRHKIRKRSFWAFIFFSILIYGAIAFFVYF